MSFAFISEAPDITEQIPVQLGGQFRRAIAAASLSQGFDLAIGDVSFLLRPSPEHPYQRGLAQIEKNQLDTSDDAGEQSLGAWWTRAQNDFRAGSGVRWYEPGADPPSQDTFWRSQGVDVWDSVGAKTLPAMEEIGAHTGVGYLSTYADGVIHTSGTTLTIYDSEGGTIASHTVSTGATQTAIGGGYIWTGTDTGLDRVTESTANLDWITHDSPCRAWRAKDRLLIAAGNELWWMASSAATGTLATRGTLLYTHPSPTWEWVDISETTTSILVAGREGVESTLYAIELEETAPTGTNLPELGIPHAMWHAPSSEHITCMSVYVGTFVFIGTNLGAHIGISSPNGITVGQNVLPGDTSIVDVVFRDRFAYFTAEGNQPDGSTGAWRLDLSRTLGDSTLYAVAADVTTELAGTDPSIAFVGETGRVVLRTSDGLFFASATDFAPISWLETGRVRFRTNELKVFASMKAAGDLTHGQITSEFQVTGTDRWEPLTILDNHSTLDVDHPIPFPATGSIRLRFTFATATAESPVLGGWTLKGLPIMKRPKVIRLPLSVADVEVTQKGIKAGYQGWAVDRRLVLEALLDSEMAIPIAYAGDSRTHVVTIEDYVFSNITAGDGSLENKGGIVDLTIREIAIVE